MMSGPSQWERTHSRSAIVMEGSKSSSMSSAMVRSQAVSDAKDGGLVVRKLIHQTGWVAVSTTVRSVSAGGIEKPLRTSRSRMPATGTSTVSMSASNPAAFARVISSSPAPRSFQT